MSSVRSAQTPRRHHAGLGRWISCRGDHLRGAVSLRTHGPGSGARQQVHGTEAPRTAQEPWSDRLATASKFRSRQAGLHVEEPEGRRVRGRLLLARPLVSARPTAWNERGRVAPEDRPEPPQGPAQRANSSLPRVEGSPRMGMSTEKRPGTSCPPGASCCGIQESPGRVRLTREHPLLPDPVTASSRPPVLRT